MVSNYRIDLEHGKVMEVPDLAYYLRILSRNLKFFELFPLNLKHRPEQSKTDSLIIGLSYSDHVSAS